MPFYPAVLSSLFTWVVSIRVQGIHYVLSLMYLRANTFSGLMWPFLVKYFVSLLRTFLGNYFCLGCHIKLGGNFVLSQRYPTYSLVWKFKNFEKYRWCGMSQWAPIKRLVKRTIITTERVTFGKLYFGGNISGAPNGHKSTMNITRSNVPHNLPLVTPSPNVYLTSLYGEPFFLTHDVIAIFNVDIVYHVKDNFQDQKLRNSHPLIWTSIRAFGWKR